VTEPEILVGAQALDSEEDREALVDAMNESGLDVTAGRTDRVEIAESEGWVAIAIALWLGGHIADKALSVVLDATVEWARERFRRRESRPREVRIYGPNGDVIRRVEIEYED
jgi:hypothetical protein